MRHAVIMAGGSGTRLWPLSRQSEPKQLLPLIDGRSLLELAGDRLEGARLEGGQLVGAISPERRFVCAVEIHRARILASLPWLKDDHFLGEPEGRDTLNAVGFAAAISSLDDADATLAVLTADHRIEPQSEFARALELAFRLVESQPTRFATFGITPSFAATGYGWVERGEAIQISPTGASAPTRDAGAAGAFVAKSFVEKPDRARAEQFLASGRHSWNSGMFVFHAET
ncbi:MAG: mannose-1-phosphate guanylyltransferase, partial [Phycisphaerae bacterium]|nr:mannose-1-phosphate guanylyltransferase [Phycisphaerae bacterium]